MNISGLRTTTAMAAPLRHEGTQRRQWNRVLRRKTLSGFPHPVFKILFTGDQCTGKTSLVQRYVHDTFTEHHQSTIAADFLSRTIGWTINTTVRLHLWDISGQQRFSALTRPFYRHADAAFVVFDASRLETFKHAVAWKADLDDRVRLACGAGIPCVLLANKCDLPEKQAFVEDDAYMDAWSVRHGFQGWLRTSAKEDIGVDEAMECLLMNLMDGPVHRRLHYLEERQYALREDEVACACMRDEYEPQQQAAEEVRFISPRERGGTIALPEGEAVCSRCCCW